MYDIDLGQMLVEYDQYRDFCRYLRKYASVDSIVPQDDIRHRIITLVDREGQVICRSPFEVIAYYLPDQKIWRWSWSWIPRFQAENFGARKLIAVAIKQEMNRAYLRNILVQSSAILEDREQIHINLAIATTSIKCPFVYSVESILEDGSKIWHFYLLIDNEQMQQVFEEYQDRRSG